MTILVFIAVLFLLVLVHEFGHFITAKWSKMRVDEFAIGFPPRIASWTKGETTYALNLLPIGGYVKIYGENGEDAETPDTPRAFMHRPKHLQALVLVAGVTMNILLAFVLYAATYVMGVAVAIPEEERSATSELVIASVLPNGPAGAAGLRPGDRVQSLTDESGATANLTPSSIASFISEREGQTLNLTYERAEETVRVELTPRTIEVNGEDARPRVGFVTGLIEMRQYPVTTAVVMGAEDTWSGLVRITQGVWMLLKQAVKGDASIQDVTGPIGIAGMVGDASRFGLTALMTFTAFISLNLAVINLLPIPALDGGRLIVVGIEALIRRPLNQTFIARMNLVGFAFLMLLMVAVTVGDVLKIVR
jgi:regulator of sigma E protease